MFTASTHPSASNPMSTPANMELSLVRKTGGQVGEDLGQIGPGVQENEKEDAGAADTDPDISVTLTAELHPFHD